MHMVAVGDIVLVGNTGHDAKALLQALGEFVGGGFQRGAIEGVVDVLGLFPGVALVVHVLHHAQSKGLCTGIGVALAGHILHAFIQTGIAQTDGGVAAEQQLVDLFALLQAGQRTILPQDGCGIAGGAQQSLVPCLQCAVAQSQTLVEDLPELLKVALGGECHIHQIDGDNALIEPTVVFGLAGLGVHIGGQEAAAAHAGVAVAFAVFVHLELQHLLFGDIVGHHALCGALGGQLGQIIVGSAGADVVLFQHIDQLGEGGGNPHTGLVLHALIALADGLLNDDGKVCLLLRIARLAQIHEHGDKGGLTIGGHQRDHLILDGLHTAVDLAAQAALYDLLLALSRNVQTGHFHFYLSGDLLAGDIHKGGEVGQADALAAVLVGCYLCNDLGGDVAGGGEAVRLFNIGAGNDGAVLQHVLQIHQIAVVHVLGKVVGIVEVDQTLLMGLDDLRVQQQTGGEIFGDLTGHIVALYAVHGGVLVGVLLLDLFVLALDQAQDALIGGVGLALQALHIAVGDVVPGHIMCLDVHELVLHHILHFFHADGAVQRLTLVGNSSGDLGDLVLCQTALAAHRIAGLSNSGDDLGDIKGDLCTVAFDDLHRLSSLTNKAQCERVSLTIRDTRFAHTISNKLNVALFYHYLVASQGKYHYILRFGVLAKIHG